MARLFRNLPYSVVAADKKIRVEGDMPYNRFLQSASYKTRYICIALTLHAVNMAGGTRKNIHSPQSLAFSLPPIPLSQQTVAAKAGKV
jgi:hypothetical protein